MLFKLTCEFYRCIGLTTFFYHKYPMQCISLTKKGQNFNSTICNEIFVTVMLMPSWWCQRW